MRVRIPKNMVDGFYTGEFVVLDISDECPICKAERGVKRWTGFVYVGSKYYDNRMPVDCWENACEHQDKYQDVLWEAEVESWKKARAEEERRAKIEEIRRKEEAKLEKRRQKIETERKRLAKEINDRKLEINRALRLVEYKKKRKIQKRKDTARKRVSDKFESMVKKVVNKRLEEYDRNMEVLRKKITGAKKGNCRIGYKHKFPKGLARGRGSGKQQAFNDIRQEPITNYLPYERVILISAEYNFEYIQI